MAGTYSRPFIFAIIFFLAWNLSLSHGAATPSSGSDNPSKPSDHQITNALVDGALQNGAGDLAGLLQSADGVATTVVNLVVSTWAALITWNAWLIRFVKPELHYSYGHSPPVYPTPQGPGTGSWAPAYAQARQLVEQMTDQEKNNITFGISATAGCSGFSGGVPRLGFPGLCLNDAESGVRTASLVNGYPAQLHIGASWNRSLALDRGIHIGQEFKAKGVNVALGPVIGPMGRIAKGGRNWEGFTNDPYLAGSLVGPTIDGMQQSVIACAKHFLVNEQETNRNLFFVGMLSSLINLNNSVSSNVDDRTMHELYMFPWYDAVKAGVGSVMCSYNRANNSYACQNSKLMNGLLKTELGFEGLVVSDWYAHHTGIAAANAGMDLAMPSSPYWNNDQLATAVKNGSVNATRLDDMATRIVAAWYHLADFSSSGLDGTADVDARNQASEQTILQGAIEGHVLVKNTNNILPFKQPKVLNLFGYDAVGGKNTSSLLTSFSLYPDGLTNTQHYTDGRIFTDIEATLFLASAEPAGSSGPEVALDGTMISGGGSGSITPVAAVSPFDAFSQQASIDGTVLHTDFVSQHPTVKDANNPCIVFINAQSSESWDRASLADEYSDTLVTNVASQCKNTIVVIHNAGVRLVDRWVDHPNITAIIFAHLPGQASGTALVEIMYGHQSPSGRLPYTVAKSESDYGSLLNPTLPDRTNPQYSQSDFSEGLYIDYKHFIKNNIAPRYAFGYGLTYTNFTYSSLQVSRNTSANTTPIPYDKISPSAVAPEGGLESLYDIIATITVDITNTGNYSAAEVAQLYIDVPNSGLPKALRGFEKKFIEPGQSASCSFPLRRRDLSVWDVNQQVWVLQTGTFDVMVGKSVLDIQVTGTLVL